MTTAAEHRYVLQRDGRCFAARFDPAHVCRDQWGTVHRADDLSKLTVDHVHLHPGGTKGKRAKDDRRHMVAMCSGANVGVPSRLMRQAEREYLAEVEP